MLWKKRTLIFCGEKTAFCRECVIMGCLAVLMAVMAVMFIPSGLLKEIQTHPLYSTTTVLFFVGVEGVIFFVVNRLSGKWLSDGMERNVKSEFRLSRQFEKLKKGNAGIFSGIYREQCRAEVERELPYWMLRLSLLLSGFSVYRALEYSLEATAGMFKKEVRRLLCRIRQDPVSLIPYNEFFSVLEIPELQSCMKLLYSLNSNGDDGTGWRLRTLVEQNSIVMDRQENEKRKLKLAGMGMLKQFPMLLCGAKMMCDIVLLLLTSANTDLFFV